MKHLLKLYFETAIILALIIFTSFKGNSQNILVNWEEELPFYKNLAHEIFNEGIFIQNEINSLADSTKIIKYFSNKDSVDYNVYYCFDTVENTTKMYLVNNKKLVSIIDTLKNNFNYGNFLKSYGSIEIEPGIKIYTDINYINNLDSSLSYNRKEIETKIVELEFYKNWKLKKLDERNGELEIIYSLYCSPISLSIDKLYKINNQLKIIGVSCLFGRLRSIHSYNFGRNFVKDGFSFYFNLSKHEGVERIEYSKDGHIIYSLYYYWKWIKSYETYGDTNNLNISITYYYNLFNRISSIVYQDSKFKDSRIYSIQFRNGRFYSKTIFNKESNLVNDRKIIYYNRKQKIKKVEEKVGYEY